MNENLHAALKTADPKVMLPISFCSPTIFAAAVGGMVVEDEPSHQ